MDYETKIYLEKLIEAIESPDWWSVGITAVNALIVIGLTIWQLCLNNRQTQIQERQNELQEYQTQLQKVQTDLLDKQTKQQEYETYRRIYRLISNIDMFVDLIISRVSIYLLSETYFNSRKDYFNELSQELEALNTDFDDSLIDIELKKCASNSDVRIYYDIIAETRSVLGVLKYHLANGNIDILKYPMDQSQLDWPADNMILISAIAKCFNEEYEDGIKKMLLHYAEIVESHKKTNILNNIKKRITPIDA